MFKALLASAVAAVIAQDASASLTYDLRAVSITGLGTVTNTKQVAGVRVGDVITFDLFVQVPDTNSNTADDQYQFSHFSVQTGGALNVLGNLGSSFSGNEATSGAVTEPTFSVTSQAGSFNVDLNADGRTDVGSTSTTVAAGWIKPRSASLAGTTGGLWKVATLQLKINTVADLNSAAAMTVNYVLPVGATIQSSNHVVFKDNNLNKTASTGVFVVSAPVNIVAFAVPEPSAFGMVLVGALGLVGFRRLGFRRTA